MNVQYELQTLNAWNGVSREAFGPKDVMFYLFIYG